jgi:hypothetical protein
MLLTRALTMGIWREYCYPSLLPSVRFEENNEHVNYDGKLFHGSLFCWKETAENSTSNGESKSDSPHHVKSLAMS